jgi:hypothetical protein
VSQPLWREEFLESSPQSMASLLYASQPETAVTSQLRRETIFRRSKETVHNAFSDNFTVLYDLRKKIRP